MQTNDVTFLYLLVVFDAISAQTIVMSTAHILLPNVHHTKSIYACALYSWPVSFQPRIQIMVVVVADVVVVILGFFSVDFSMLVLVHSTKCSLYMLTKIPKIKKSKSLFSILNTWRNKNKCIYSCRMQRTDRDISKSGINF